MVPPYRFNMQENKVSSFAIVDNMWLDPTGSFQKKNIIDLIKKLEHKAHVYSVGLANALEETFQSQIHRTPAIKSHV